ncbi:hypothetical protein CPC08DRAFT_139502 [Agrocybe pediades]|nr:hypothetical protein CPC08DRAFT_139502 [Agrocybe pediades]
MPELYSTPANSALLLLLVFSSNFQRCHSSPGFIFIFSLEASSSFATGEIPARTNTRAWGYRIEKDKTKDEMKYVRVDSGLKCV